MHAWSTIFTYRLEKAQKGKGDTEWLKSNFQKLLLNFTWWVNRKDRSGRNIFEGGFLGLDNIGVFDRSAPLPTGGYLEQADGTAWMALFCQNMLEIAAELAMTDPDYADMALKFVEHFLWIASSMTHMGRRYGHVGRGRRLLLRRAAAAQRPGPAAQSAVDGRTPAPVRGHDVRRAKCWRNIRRSGERLQRFLAARPEMRAAIHDPGKTGVAGRRLASILDETKLRRVLAKMLDENEFLSEFGIRSLSRFHADTSVCLQRRRPGVSRFLFAGRVRYRHVRRQFQLARPDLDAGQCADHSRSDAILRLLRQRLHGRMPDRLRTAR